MKKILTNDHDDFKINKIGIITRNISRLQKISFFYQINYDKGPVSIPLGV